MKPKDSMQSDTVITVSGDPTIRRDSTILTFDTMDVVLLDSQSPVPVGLRIGSQRSSLSSTGTVIAHVAHDTGHAFRTDVGPGLQVDSRGGTEFYRVDDDSYRPFTIYGATGDGKGKIATLPASTTGSLSSIITTSIASSEPDRGDHRIGGGGGTGCSGSLAGDTSDGGPLEEKYLSAGGTGRSAGPVASEGAINDGGGTGDLGHGAGIRQEKWWYMTLQIAIPFFVAGVGTIGAGIILQHPNAPNAACQLLCI